MFYHSCLCNTLTHILTYVYKKLKNFIGRLYQQMFNEKTMKKLKKKTKY